MAPIPHPHTVGVRKDTVMSVLVIRYAAVAGGVESMVLAASPIAARTWVAAHSMVSGIPTSRYNVAEYPIIDAPEASTFLDNQINEIPVG